MTKLNFEGLAKYVVALFLTPVLLGLSWGELWQYVFSSDEGI